MTAPPWYAWLESKLEPSFPLMTVIGLIIVGVTLWLIMRGKPIPLAGWLTYLVMP